MPAIAMKHDEDPKDVLLNAIGNSLGDIEVFNNQCLVALYKRPEMTKGGLHLTQTSRAEEHWQGKAALILKHGPQAFQDPEGRWFQGADLKAGDWIVMRPSDGWPLSLNKVECRIINDTAVRARINSPDLVW